MLYGRFVFGQRYWWSAKAQLHPSLLAWLEYTQEKTQQWQTRCDASHGHRKWGSWHATAFCCSSVPDMVVISFCRDSEVQPLALVRRPEGIGEGSAKLGNHWDSLSRLPPACCRPGLFSSASVPWNQQPGSMGNGGHGTVCTHDLTEAYLRSRQKKWGCRNLN